MAFSDFFTNLKDRAVQMYQNFFYEGRPAQQEAAPQKNAYQAPEQSAPVREPQWNAYGQAAQQNPYTAPYQGMQQPYQPQPYAQPQPVYQASYQAAQQQPAAQAPYAGTQPQSQERAPRFRRSSMHAQEQQAASNVVNFPYAAPVQTPEQPQEPQQSAGLLNARIINARSMGDCRSAITLLRNGDAVLIVMENITNPGDMRRLVDTLSGACYSLTATITKVSRYGVYLLAPQTIAVFADQATNQMNAGPARSQNYQSAYAAAQRPAYTAQPAPQAQAQPAYAPQPQQQPFTQRPTPAPVENTQTFYPRAMPQQNASIPSFTNRPVNNYGFVPDEAAEAAQ